MSVGYSSLFFLFMNDAYYCFSSKGGENNDFFRGFYAVKS